MNRYSSLNRDNNNDNSNKYTSKYSNNNNNNTSNSNAHNGSNKYSSNSSNGTTNRFGGGGKEDESAASGPGTSKYSFESILAKYKTNEESRQQQAANGTTNSSSNSNSNGTQQSSRNYQNNTFPRTEKVTEAPSSISSTLSLTKPNVLELKPSVSSLSSPPVTSESRTATKDTDNRFSTSGQNRFSKPDSQEQPKDSLTPIVCRTSASSLTVTTPSYSRSNSNNSTETSGLYSRQVSNDNTPGRGSALGAPINGHLFTNGSGDNSNTFGNSLERRSSKKYSHSGSGGWSDRKIEKANDVAEKIEQTLAKHQVHHHEPATTDPSNWRQRDASVTRTGNGKPVREREPSVDRSEKSRILQDRGTSPGLETSQNSSAGSRIGRASEIYSVRKTTYFQPNTREISSQTEAYYLKDRNSEAVDNFDLYDHVKKSFQFTSYSDKTNGSTVNERLEKQKEKEDEVSKKFNMTMTPMTNMMPGHQRTSRDETSAENNCQNNNNLSVPPATAKAETESEWETDDDVIEAKPEEAKLEDALAKLDQLDLDSDDEKRYR